MGEKMDMKIDGQHNDGGSLDIESGKIIECNFKWGISAETLLRALVEEVKYAIDTLEYHGRPYGLARDARDTLNEALDQIPEAHGGWARESSDV